MQRVCNGPEAYANKGGKQRLRCIKGEQDEGRGSSKGDDCAFWRQGAEKVSVP